MTSKRELVLGALVIALLGCLLLKLAFDAANYSFKQNLITRDSGVATVLGWVLTFASLWGFGLGIAIVSGILGIQWKQFGQMNLKATIPVYFIFALVPIVSAAVLMVAGEMQWAFALSGLAVLAIPLYLWLGIKA